MSDNVNHQGIFNIFQPYIVGKNNSNHFGMWMYHGCLIGFK